MSLNNLPVEWLSTSIENIAKIIAGGTPKANDPENFVESPDGIGWLTPADLSGYSNKYIGYGKRNLSEQGYKTSSAKLMPKGSVVFSSRAPIGYVAIASNEISTNQGFKSFVIDENISSEYLYYYLKSIRDLAESLGTGTTFKELSGSACKKLPFVLAPLAEQQEIVRQLDVLLAQVEQIKARLDAIPAILKKFRQSVLADAVSGQLLDDDVDSSIYSVKEIFEITSGIAFKKSEYTEDGYKLLQIANVSHGKTKWETLNFVSEQNAKQFDGCILRSCDVVVALNRPITHDLLKVAKITEQDLPAILYQRVACLRVKDNELVDSEFLFLSMQTTSFRKAIEEKLRGSDQPYLNTSDLGNLTINLIPLDKQKLALKKVSILLFKSNKIEMTVQSAQKRVNLLTQSILAKAFSGELTAEWREQHQELITGVNSAENLLAKIQAEREATKPVKKVKKVKSI